MATNNDKGMQEFEDFLARLAEEKPVVRRFVPNELRIAQARTSFSALVNVFKESKCDVRMRFKQDDMSPASGHIVIEGAELRFDTIRWLSRVMELADNVDIYPLSNGTIRMTLGFHGLLDMVEPGRE